VLGGCCLKAPALLGVGPDGAARQRPLRDRTVAAPARGFVSKEEFMAALLIGYARVSSDAQDLTVQREAMAALGVAADRS
jgi:hypothetical protein